MDLLEICIAIIFFSFICAQLLQALLNVKTSKLVKQHILNVEEMKKCQVNDGFILYQSTEELLREMQRDLKDLAYRIDLWGDQLDVARADIEDIRDAVCASRIKHQAVIKRTYKKRKPKTLEHKEVPQSK